jgi:hypothetical protein
MKYQTDEPAVEHWTMIIGDRLCSAQEVVRHIAGGKAHYVYVLARTDGAPFYVGKGYKSRVLQHEAEARISGRLSHKLNVIRAMWKRGEAISYCIESFHDEEAAALARERALIRLWGRHDLRMGPLTNQTDGGEGASNPSEESREQRRQNLSGEEAPEADRRTANRFFQQLCSVQSVPVKPLAKFKTERLWANRDKFAMSSRQAAALAASAIANRILLCEGAIIPRMLMLDGIPMAIENGVGRDILSSGMAGLAVEDAGKETFALTQSGYRYILSTIAKNVLLDAGVIEPTV